MKGRGEPQFIRVLMDEGGWKGPHLVMATDVQKEENDQVFCRERVDVSH